MIKANKGDATALVIIGLAVALVGALGYIFWQNTLDKGSGNDVHLSQADSKEEATKQDTKVEEDPNKGYVVLPDWDVRFKTPSGGIVFAKNKEGYNSYGLTTKRVTELDDKCSVENHPLVTIERDISDSPRFGTLVNSEAIDGYYYFWLAPGAGPCSENGQSMQISDRSEIIEIVKGLEKAK